MKSFATILSLVLVLVPYVGASARLLYGQVSHLEQIREISRQPDAKTKTSTAFSNNRLPAGNELNFIGATDLASPGLTAEIPTRGRSVTELATHLRDDLAAIGVAFAPRTKIVISVDPASDCWGVIVPGDKLLSIAGENPRTYVLAGRNYGRVGEAVTLCFRQPSGRVQKVLCRRSPVESFSRKYRNEMRPPNEFVSRTSDQERLLLSAKNSLSLE